MTKILCVEDEDPIREDIVEELEDAGYTVLQARDGSEAMQVVENDTPDLVLSDINMPNMNGAQLLVKLRKTCPQFDDIPFIFLTAFSDRNDVLSGTQLGADDYLTKPIDYELLTVKIEQHLRSANRIKKKKEREFETQANQLVTELTGLPRHNVRNIHKIMIVMVGAIDGEQKVFTSSLQQNHFTVIVFADEASYFRKFDQLPVHFTFLWNYSYAMHRAFSTRESKCFNKNISVRIFSQRALDKADVVPVEHINSIIKLPITMDNLKQRLVQLVEEKIAILYTGPLARTPGGGPIPDQKLF